MNPLILLMLVVVIAELIDVLIHYTAFLANFLVFASAASFGYFI